MSQDCDTRLTSLGPIMEFEIHLRCSGDGWRIWARHRHFGGHLTDCPAAVYERLSLPELIDVVCVELDTAGGATGDWGR